MTKATDKSVPQKPRPTLIKRFLVISGVASGIFLGILAILAFLGSRIDPKHQSTTATTIPATPAKVWPYISDFENQPTWNQNIVKVEAMNTYQGYPVWREIYTSGESLTFYVEESSPPTKLIRVIHDENSPFQGKWLIELSPEAEGSSTQLKVTEFGIIENPLLRYLAHRVMGTDTFIKSYANMINQAVVKAAGSEPTRSEEGPTE